MLTRSIPLTISDLEGLYDLLILSYGCLKLWNRVFHVMHSEENFYTTDSDHHRFSERHSISQYSPLDYIVPVPLENANMLHCERVVRSLEKMPV